MNYIEEQLIWFHNKIVRCLKNVSYIRYSNNHCINNITKFLFMHVIVDTEDLFVTICSY